MTPRDIVVAELRKADADLSDEAVAHILEQWELLALSDEGRCKAVALIRGTEFHCHLETGFRLRRGVLRDFLAPLLARRGYLTTRVRIEDAANQRFNKAFGFVPTWRDDVFQYFILTELPFRERRVTCQL